MKEIGAGSIDTLKSERQFDLISFSNFDCVKGLIKHRSTVDHYRGIESNKNPFAAGDVRPMNPAIIALFVSLDNLLDQCNLTKKQRLIIEKIMDGYTEQDVADIFKQDVWGITKTLNRVCKRIIDIDQRNWIYEYVYMNKLKSPFKYKKCTVCGKWKAVTVDFFYMDALGKDGFKNKCRLCASGQ